MKEIQLSEKSNSMHKEFAPVALSENVTVEAGYSITNGNISVEGSINQGERNIGRFTMNDKEGRLFLNVKTDGLKYGTKSEIVETVASIITQLIPEDAAEEEETVEG